MMTLSKLAKLAHVSLSTASKAFSMSSDVNEETREMIFDLARKHDCFKKFYNAKYPRFVIAVICPEFRSRYYSSLISAIGENLDKLGCEVCVASTDFSSKTCRELYDYYNNYSKVDGIIMVDSFKENIEDNNVPVVTGGSARGKAISVRSSSSAGVMMAVDYLIKQNVKDIGFIGETHTASKLKVFKEYMHQKGQNVNINHIAVSEDRMELGGYNAMSEILERGDLPRAILCAYDCIAIGAIKCIFDNGLMVPEDIAIIGINNNRESEYLNPPLSSVDLRIEEVGKEMAVAMVNQLLGKECKKEIKITPKLIIRKSSEIQ